MPKLYYIAPPDKAFEEVKARAMELWALVGSHPDYVEEKQSRIRDIKNIEDNMMYMVAMFDQGNMRKLSKVLTPETRKEIRDRMLDGGYDECLIPF